VTDGHLYFEDEDITEAKTNERAKKGLFLSFQAPEEIPGITMENFLKSARAALTGKEVKAFPFHTKRCLPKCRSFRWTKAMPSVM
jgi:Fe-S cluster assembly ATP-binding protein